MYKKLTCVFCLAISSFIIAVVVYLLLTRTFSEKPPEIEVPRISIYLFNATTRREQLVSSGPDEDIIIDYENLHLSTPNSDASGATTTSKSSNRNTLRIQCHSNYPVQLKYSGFGNVTNARNYNRRKIEDFGVRSSYTYYTELQFITVDEGITGRYTCKVRDDGVTKASTSVYIYATGAKSFVSHSTRELVVKPNSVISIPCPVSYPNKSVILLSILQPIQTIVEKEVESERIRGYDPKRGFILQPNSWGSFVCKDEKSLELSGRVTVFMPLDHVVKGRTLRILSQNVDNEDRSLKVGCQAKEPVDLRFINFIKFTKPVREMKNETHEFPYMVRIKLDTGWFRGNTSMVECFTKKDSRVIKTWKFLKYPGKISPLLNCHPPLSYSDCRANRQFVELHGNNEHELENPHVFLRTSSHKANQYQCCSNRDDMRPILTTYPCNTPTECELRMPCLSLKVPRYRTTLNCPLFDEANEPIYEGDKGCTLLKVEHDRSGLVRCSLDSATMDYVYFNGLDMNQTWSTTAASLSLTREQVNPRTILKVTQKGFRSQNVQKGSPIRFDCVGSKLHLASGFQFGVDKVNEPIKYLANKGPITETDTGVHHEWIDVPYTDQFKRFYCFAPLLNPPLYGEQWINVSIPIRYDIYW